MSVRITMRPRNDPDLGGFCDLRHFGDVFGGLGNFGQTGIKVDRCPICGGSTLPGNNSLYRTMGYTGVKDGHAYSCRNLSVTFCDACLTGVGGVDIISNVVEASDAYRKQIQTDCDALIDERRRRRNSIITKWVIGVSIAALAIGVCCLIWKPEAVFCVLGVIAFLVFGVILQGAERR